MRRWLEKTGKEPGRRESEDAGEGGAESLGRENWKDRVERGPEPPGDGAPAAPWGWAASQEPCGRR